jgi:mannose-6-phosphate isomerase-like protein (cupin superfamily)
LHYRVENTGSEKLVFIEAQSGNYLGEDDIVRLEGD